MKKTSLNIGGIPAVLWGPSTDRLFIAVHGDQSHKADTVIALFAEEATRAGWQVLSFDLPEHGDRQGEPTLCKVEACVADLKQVMAFARGLSPEIGLFGCSLGAYFGMMAYRDEPLSKALFLSPVVDMRHLIENMMLWFDVSPERLRQEQEIATPMNTLYWDYYQYVCERPVVWDKPTALLYGTDDALCARGDIDTFVMQSGAVLSVLEGGEHFFHTEEQLSYFQMWLRAHL